MLFMLEIIIDYNEGKYGNNLRLNQVKTVAYADFVDSRGELLLKDTREHTHTKVYLKKL